MKPIEAVAQYRIRAGEDSVDAGETFDCTDQGLIDCGAAIPTESFDDDEEDGHGGTGNATDSTDANPSTGGDLTDEQKAEAIAEVLAGWLESDPEKADTVLWKANGEPRNSAVDKALGFDVTNAMIAPVWAALQPANEDA